MGQEVCKCQANQFSSTQVFFSSTLKNNVNPDANNIQSTQFQVQQYDNPSRDLFDHKFLNTTVTASNNLLKNPSKMDDSHLLEPLKENSQLLSYSIYKIDSLEAVISKRQSSKQTKDGVADKQKQQQIFNLVQKRQRRASIESKIHQNDLLIYDKFETLQPTTTPEILHSISQYILSEKNLFQPIKVAKQNFIRFKSQDIHQSYVFIDKIGQGSYGIVYKVKNKHFGDIRAAKIMKKSKISDLEKSKLINEINILKKLDHPNIIKIYEAFFYENFYCIITQYCEGGSLLKQVQVGKHFNEQAIKVIFRKILSALTYIHKMNIVHRDIKLDNIVLVNKFQSTLEVENIDIRLIDFGLAKILTSKRVKDREKVGTYTHMAPEVLQGVYSSKCDLWSAGILLYLMISGLSPFKKSTKDLTYESIMKQTPRFQGQVWRRTNVLLKDLISKLLKKNINQRITAVQALHHPFFRAQKESYIDPQIFDRVARRFYGYNRANNFISVIESYLAYTSTSPAKQKEYTEMFEALDSNCDGYIGKQQLQNAFIKSGLTLSQKQLEFELDKVDKNYLGKINYNQFVAILSDRNMLFTKQSLASAFQYFDSNSNGVLQKEEIQDALKSANYKQLASILIDLDLNQDQKISQEQFISYLQKQNII